MPKNPHPCLARDPGSSFLALSSPRASLIDCRWLMGRPHDLASQNLSHLHRNHPAALLPHLVLCLVLSHGLHRLAVCCALRRKPGGQLDERLKPPAGCETGRVLRWLCACGTTRYSRGRRVEDMARKQTTSRVKQSQSSHHVASMDPWICHAHLDLP